MTRNARNGRAMRLLAGAIAAAIACGGTAGAQNAPSLEGRVSRLEGEMRAVQRQVFPDGAGRMVQPQIAPPSAPMVAPGEPATSPIADLTARVAALENQVRRVTGDVEQNQYRLRRLEEKQEALDARMKAVEATAAAPGAVATGDSAPAVPPPARPTPTPPPPARPVAVVPDRPAAAGIDRPNSGDPADDGYVYGYRLWLAKRYPEAQTVLKEVVTKYPNYRRASYARNLLGRAYLDGGAPSLAAVTFYENYKKLPDGDRAPESLYFLAQALVRLKKPAAEVCKVYGELADVYGGRIPVELQAKVDQGRAASKCR